MVNILNKALSLIPRYPFRYRICTGVATDGQGIRIPEFGEWMDGDGHVQPGIIAGFGTKNISEHDIHEIGLDFSRKSITVWANNVNLRTLAGRPAADQVMFNGLIYQVANISDWLPMNRWKRYYCQLLIEEVEA